MRRALGLLCAIAGLALPAPVTAAIPVRPVGPPAPLTTITFAPGAGSARVYGITGRDLWRSDDKGSTWLRSGYVPDSPFNCTLSVSPLNQDWLYTGCEGMSRDGGKTWKWEPVLDNTPQIDASGTLYSLEYNTHGLFHRCTADVSSCADVLLPGPDQALVDPASIGLIVDGLSRSVDGGATWSPFSLPAGMQTFTFAFDGRTPRKLLVFGKDVYNHQFLAISPDAGATWGPSRPFPFDAQDSGGSLVRPGGAGALRRIWIYAQGGAAWTADDGVTFHAVHAGAVVVDPDDGTHAFEGDTTLLLETRDTGASWTLRNAPQFGYDEFSSFTGSGSTFYAIVQRVLWSSHDGGLSWAPVPALADAQMASVRASRDDPRIAYAKGWPPGGTGVVWQTADAGATWTPHPAPPDYDSIDWIQSGHPDWLLVGQEESHDAGATWTYVDSLHPFGDADHRVTPYVVTDATTGARFSEQPLGTIAPDGSVAWRCAPGAATCSVAAGYIAYDGDVWVEGGHATFATVPWHGDLWAARDDGRWWRIQEPVAPTLTQSYSTTGNLSNPQLALVGHAYAVWNGLLIPLQAPVLDPPTVSQGLARLHCATALTADYADIAYVWRRDGVAIAGSNAADHAVVAADTGRDLTCVVTASNAWGSSTSASLPTRMPGIAASRAHLTLAGSAAAGLTLRCGATVHVDWLRNGHALAGRHGRTYLVRTRDEGHALACRSRAADGTLSSSPAVRVPRARGGAALETT